MERCPRCGAILALVGHMHRCVPRARELPRVEAVRPPLPAPVTKNAVTKIPVTENRVTKKPRGRPRKEHPLTGAERTRRWRSRDGSSLRSRIAASA